MPVITIGPILQIVLNGTAPKIALDALSVVFTTLIGAMSGLRSHDGAGCGYRARLRRGAVGPARQGAAPGRAPDDLRRPRHRRARSGPRGDHRLLTGQKMWISLGSTREVRADIRLPEGKERRDVRIHSRYRQPRVQGRTHTPQAGAPHRGHLDPLPGQSRGGEGGHARTAWEGNGRGPVGSDARKARPGRQLRRRDSGLP